MLRSLYLAALSATALAAPSPRSLNSDIAILIYNDLQGTASAGADSGVIVLEARSYNDANAACAVLGEQLWSPRNGTSTPTLDYLKYLNSEKGESRFWIASKGTISSTIDYDGRTSRTAPSTKLPVLCTQSAPFSNETVKDTSEKWQVMVHSNNEYLTGFRDRYSFRFLGVRYASQPQRFTYSTPYVGNGDQVSASEYGSQCVQGGNTGSEDCLFLNIWTNFLPGPHSSKKNLKPVMIWIHGGAFTGGTGNDPTADGGNLASRGDVVVVDINYRLTTLGFLALNDGKTNGNFGLADQVNALDWVEKNIANFGGDPHRITIFGQSAGAGSVRALIASPKATGKFAAAIPLSNLGGINYGTTYSKYYTIDQEMAVAGYAILNATNCTNAVSQVDCLRAVSAYDLANLATVARYPVVDGTYLVADELQLYGSPLNVRLMLGTTRDDGAAMISFPKITNQSAYLNASGFSVPPANLFPIPALENQTLALYNMSARLATDGIFRCIDQATVKTGLETGVFQPNVYYYEFNRTYQIQGWPALDVCEPPKTASHPYGDPNGEYFKCHSGELYYVFGNLVRQGLPMRDENDLPFEQFVLDSFASFARAYDPNPDLGYLKARGYHNTIDELAKAGKWQPSTKKSLTKRTLQWPSFQGPFTELEQCEALGLSIDYYERRFS
ncbi:Alpha/Beta hydrolase protein [Truncatella angustata]|uniref:Carboxylic ester hydrolase n=1 Tax=Truncatella angustata TaxID=152316 RepID=A0A9P8ULI2_9PEZI|nr:Alpha/Beta hydrolase protein [Truncatella angustata]KAH6654745.1 Alpha/Beta hydrolase protein [Truncatella angustata]